MIIKISQIASNIKQSYVYVVFYFVTMLRLNEKVIFIVSFSLLFLHILLGECLSALGIVVPIPIVRNFALMGIPFFALGGKVCLVL